MPRLSNGVLFCALLLGVVSCLPHGAQEQSDFYSLHWPKAAMEQHLESQGYRVTGSNSAFSTSGGTGWKAEAHFCLIVSDYQGNPEELLDFYKGILTADMKEGGIPVGGLGQQGPVPNLNLRYSQGDLVGKLSARVTPLENGNLAFEVWKSET